MKLFFLSFLAIFFPWVILFLDDNPGGAMVALVMQATLLGWVPASMWAWRIVHGTTKGNAHKRKTKETNINETP